MISESEYGGYRAKNFALDLIESYGSGIRRAKDALKENHSPELQFLPDNDTVDTKSKQNRV